MKKFLSVITLSIISLSSVYSQFPGIEWVLFFGGDSHDVCYEVLETSQGNYIATGFYTRSSQDLYLVMISPSGDTIWSKCWGGTGMESAHHILETANHDLLITGYTESFGNGGKDVYIIRTDSSGNEIWSKTYGGNLQDCGYFAYENSDGTFLVLGYRDGPSDWIKGDLYIIKIDANGDSLWTKAYGGIDEEWANGLVPTNDGNFMITGATRSWGMGGKDIWVLKIDSSGDTLWTKTYGDVNEDNGYDIINCADGNFLITGYINGSGLWTFGDIWILKIDSGGDTLWTKTYAGEGEEAALKLCEDQQQNLIIGGNRGINGNDIWLIKTDSGGDSLWSVCLGGVNSEQALDMKVTADRGFLLGGWTNTYGNGSNNFYIIKILPDTLETAVEENHDPWDPLEIFPVIITGNNFEINFHLNSSGLLTVTLFDLSGRMVREIINQHYQPGEYSYRSSTDNSLKGMYFLQYKFNSISRCTPLIIID